MKHRIHINRHILRDNQKTGDRNPPITVKTYKTNDHAHEVEITGTCRIIYSPDKPLSCGATVWIEVDDGTVIIVR